MPMTKLHQKFNEVKQTNKVRLAQKIFETNGIIVDPNSMFIVHAKRIHEYKRQLMTILHVIGEYLAIIKDGVKPAAPRTYILRAKLLRLTILPN